MKAKKPIDAGEQEMLDQDRVAVEKLRVGLDALDDLVSTKEPSLKVLEIRIDEHRDLIRRRFIRELTLFIAVSFFILAGMGCALLKAPVFFLLLQAAAAVLAPIVLLRNVQKRVRNR